MTSGPSGADHQWKEKRSPSRLRVNKLPHSKKILAFAIECQVHRNQLDRKMEPMTNQKKNIGKVLARAALLAVLALGWLPAAAQQAVPRDPAEPAQGKPQPKILARPAGRVLRASVDEKSMKALIGKLVACGTRLTLSS